MYSPTEHDPFKASVRSRGIVFIPEEEKDARVFSESYRQVLSSSMNWDCTELILRFHGSQHTVTIKGRDLQHIATRFTQEELEIVRVSYPEEQESHKGCIITDIELTDSHAAASS